VSEYALHILKTAGIINPGASNPDWDSFIEVQNLIEAFDVPWTTITPLMRRFFYALSAASQPTSIVGAGTYVGFAFAWLVMGCARERRGSSLVEAVGLDIDTGATAMARRNAAILNLGAKLRFEEADAVTWLMAHETPISLLYVDVDAPDTRKSSYVEVLDAARARLAPGALIVAHDACVPFFAVDFERFHDVVRRDSGLIGPQILPLDECGVSVCRVAL
jgi:predicted O-methyltransferase YrrM